MSQERPSSVTALGAASISIGAITLLAAGMGMLQQGVLSMQPNSPPPSVLPMSDMLHVALTRPWLVGGGQGVAGAVLSAAGWGLLRCRRWARWLMEGLAWVGAALMLMFAAYVGLEFGAFLGHLFESLSSTVANVLGFLLGLVSMLSGPLPAVGFALWTLRSDEVREATEG